MNLKSLKVENYRAVRSAKLDFDNTTVLIGENDCGKSSLLDALEKVLDDNSKDGLLEFEPNEFHHVKGLDAPPSPIHIKLEFEERQTGEWSTKTFKPIKALLPEPKKKPRKLILDIQATPVTEGNSKAEWKLTSPGSSVDLDDPSALNWLRKMTPIIRLSAGLLTGHGFRGEPENLSLPETDYPSPEISSLIQTIHTATTSLLSRSTLDMANELEKGFDAARQLIASREEFDWGMLALNHTISEILGTDLKGKQQQPIALNESGSFAERLGVLLLVAALLREHPKGFYQQAEPIWILEDPEAHLHPMTLTSVALMVGHIEWQKIITTQSGDLLATIPLKQVRRLTRYNGVVNQYRVREHTLSLEDLRRLGYHQRTRNSVASFSRLWLLVEGESEFWVLPQIARLMGYEFALEGISCIEFAQCGLEPLVKAARALGIEWHLLADGDESGQNYAETARTFLVKDDEAERITMLNSLDIEHYFWEHGYAGVYEHHSRLSPAKLHHMPEKEVIRQAVRKRSKPYLALSIVEAITEPDSPGIPEVLQSIVRTCVRLAREAPARQAMNRESS